MREKQIALSSMTDTVPCSNACADEECSVSPHVYLSIICLFIGQVTWHHLDCTDRYCEVSKHEF